MAEQSNVHAQTRKRIPELDGLRGIAILLVLCWHYGASINIAPSGSSAATVANAFSLSWTGVTLFFVLSGYLIGKILIENRDADNYFSAFYIRRVARLVPVYLVVVGAYLLTSGLVQENMGRAGAWLTTGDLERTTSPIAGWSFLLHLQNFQMASAGAWGGHWLAPTWSLAVEEQFYLIVPLLIWLIPLRLLPPLLIGLIAISPLARLGIDAAYENKIASYVLLPARWDALFLGTLAAYFVTRPGGETFLRSNQSGLLLALCISILALTLMQIAGWHHYSTGMITIGHTVVALVSLNVLFVALYVERPWAKALFCNRTLQWLGLVSYGVYLLHMPVLGFVSWLLTGHEPSIITLSDFWIVAVAVPVTLAIAALSWRWFEKPIISQAARVTYRARSETSAQPAATAVA